jgi:hypothetical protein
VDVKLVKLQIHTPGKWKAVKGMEDEPDRWGIVVDGPQQYIIAIVHNGAPGDSLDTEEANAQLMAAAPEMLRACDAARRVFEAQRRVCDEKEWKDSFGLEDAAWTKLEAAIASAKGGA